MSEYKISVKPQTFPNGMIKLTFTSNGGKFGTDEILDIIKLTPEQLLNTLQANDDKTSEESALNIDLVSHCDDDTKDLIEHTKRVIDLIRDKSGIAVKVLGNRINKKLEQLK
jgi:hypothetical protein